MLRGQIDTNLLPPKLPMTAIWNNGIQNNCLISKENYWYLVQIHMQGHSCRKQGAFPSQTRKEIRKPWQPLHVLAPPPLPPSSVTSRCLCSKNVCACKFVLWPAEEKTYMYQCYHCFGALVVNIVLCKEKFFLVLCKDKFLYSVRRSFFFKWRAVFSILEQHIWLIFLVDKTGHWDKCVLRCDHCCLLLWFATFSFDIELVILQTKSFFFLKFFLCCYHSRNTKRGVSKFLACQK